MSNTAHRFHPYPQSKRSLLLACGNTLRSDDGVGWCIGNAIRHQLPHDSLSVLLTRQLLPEHAEAISTADIVIFVDCSAVIAPGTVATTPVEPAANLPAIVTHHLDPASALRLALDLYKRIPQHAVVITVGGECFALGDRLTQSVKAAVPKAIEAVQNTLLRTAPTPVHS